MCLPLSIRTVKKLEGHSAPIQALVEAPEAKKIFTTSTDRSIISWDDITLIKMKQLKTACPQLCLAWSGSDKRLYSGDSDGIIHVYNG